VIGPQVRKLRERKGWTQEDLAIKLQLSGWDTSRESVTRLENQGRRVPDLELFLLARILGVKADDLFPRNLRAKVVRVTHADGYHLLGMKFSQPLLAPAVRRSSARRKVVSSM